MATNVNASEFIRAVDDFANSIPGTVDEIVKKLAIDTFSGIVEKTPFDTGTAKRSWNIAVGRADPSVPEKAKDDDDDDDDVGGDSLKSQIELLKQASAISALSGYKASTGQFIWITSNLNYIIYLEGGSSTQAPEGMVSTTLQEVKAALEAQL